MDNQQALRRKMEAIRELKGEYLIGSQDAFNYLKAMISHEKIGQELAKDPSIKVKLSLNEISLLQEEIVWCANMWLTMTSLERTTIDNFCILCDYMHEVVFAWDKISESPGITWYYWSIEVGLVLRHILPGVQQIPSRLTLWNLFAQHAPFINCFVSKKTGEKFSGIDIIKDPKFHIGNKDGIWAKMDLLTMDDDEDRPLSEELEQLKKALQVKDALRCHQIWKTMELNEIKQRLARWSDDREDTAINQETAEYLMNFRNLMARAERELTLGHLEVERKIAIGIVYELLSEFENEPIPTAIELIINKAKERLQKSTERLKRLKNRLAPAVIIENEETTVRQNRYRYLCCFQNRRWLTKYFSS